MGKNPIGDGDDVPERPKAGKANEDQRESPVTEHCTGQCRLGRVEDSDDRESATTSRKRQGASARGQL